MEWMFAARFGLPSSHFPTCGCIGIGSFGHGSIPSLFPGTSEVVPDTQTLGLLELGFSGWTSEMTHTTLFLFSDDVVLFQEAHVCRGCGGSHQAPVDNTSSRMSNSGIHASLEFPQPLELLLLCEDWGVAGNCLCGNSLRWLRLQYDSSLLLCIAEFSGVVIPSRFSFLVCELLPLGECLHRGKRDPLHPRRRRIFERVSAPKWHLGLCTVSQPHKFVADGRFSLRV